MAGASQEAHLVSPRTPADGITVPAASRLVLRCREGDQGAWAELVTRYERLVYGVATREGLTADDAADVTQTVFESLFTSLHRLRDDERLSSWLYAVARRQAWRVRTRRRLEQSAQSMTEDGEPWLPQTAADPAEDLDRSLSLHEALQELGEPCRSLLIALYFDPTGPSYAEVAVTLGRPLGSIGPSRARCLQHLRTVMREGGWR